MANWYRPIGVTTIAPKPENAKLRERARRNVVIASGRSEADVDEALLAAQVALGGKS